MINTLWAGCIMSLVTKVWKHRMENESRQSAVTSRSPDMEEERMLPATGGIGVNAFYATGALLVIGAVFLAVMKGLSGK